MSLVIIEPPNPEKVDVVVGTTQRFGIPLGYGGPHAAFFATKEKYKRNIPGRIIGVTKDVDSDYALGWLYRLENNISKEIGQLQIFVRPKFFLLLWLVCTLFIMDQKDLKI